MDQYKNRVKEMITIPAGEIMMHDGNPFVPTDYQQEALQGTLEDIGIVDVLKAYRSQRNGGKLTLLDGHKRQAQHPDQVWPVVVLDITDEEADKQIILHNTVGMWQNIDPIKMNELIQRAKTDNEKMQRAYGRVANQILEQVKIAEVAAEKGERTPRKRPDLNQWKNRVIKILFSPGDGLTTIERALDATGKQIRGEALLEICEFYLEYADASG